MRPRDADARPGGADRRLHCRRRYAPALSRSSYGRLQERIDRLRVRYTADADAIHELNRTAAQIELYRKYSDWYGYVFYAMRRS